MEENFAQLWQKLSHALKPQVSADTFKRWFSAVKLVEATEDSVTFRVPNNIYQFWIESNHMAALDAAIVTAFGGPRTVKFSSVSESGIDTSAVKELPAEALRDTKAAGSALGLNPNLENGSRALDDLLHRVLRIVVEAEGHPEAVAQRR